MQTLINTYPDSEYLAKAKLAIADSYYKEGGTSNLTLAVSGYKDFIVFFPFLPEATYAQMQVAMAHFKQMEKPDRDRTQALALLADSGTTGRRVVVTPGMVELGRRQRLENERFAEEASAVAADLVVVGTTNRRALSAGTSPSVNRLDVSTRADAVAWVRSHLSAGDAVLYENDLPDHYP